MMQDLEYNTKPWWEGELTPDERKEIHTTWCILLSRKIVKKGEDGNIQANINAVKDYLSTTSEYWRERLAIKRPPNSLKWY